MRKGALAMERKGGSMGCFGVCIGRNARRRRVSALAMALFWGLQSLSALAGELVNSAGAGSIEKEQVVPETCAVFFQAEGEGFAWRENDWIAAGESLARYAQDAGLATCIDIDRSFELLDYYREHTEAAALYRSLDAEVDRAKEHWFNFEFAEALAVVDHAIEAVSTQMAQLDESDGNVASGLLLPLGDKKIHALLVKALILKAMGRRKELDAAFREALGLYPHLSVDALEFPPSYRARFEKVKAEALSGASGGLRIDSEPQAASVYLNGVLYGETPLAVEGLPAGSYRATVLANHYEAASMSISVLPDQVATHTLALEWRDAKRAEKVRWEDNPLFLKGEWGTEGEGPQGLAADVADISADRADLVLLAVLKEALSKGEALNAKKVILLRGINLKGGAPGLELRLLDTPLKASHRPLAIALSTLKDGKGLNWKSMGPTLLAVFQEDLLEQPEDKLDPRTGDVLVLSRRKTPLYRKPLFWAGIGVMLAGGAVGAVMALQNDNDGGGGSRAEASTSPAPEEGGVEVGFGDF